MQADNNKQLQQTGKAATLTSTASDCQYDTELCEICNQSITIADIWDHMIAHDLQYQEDEDQPMRTRTERKSESDLDESRTSSQIQLKQEENSCDFREQTDNDEQLQWTSMAMHFHLYSL